MNDAFHGLLIVMLPFCGVQYRWKYLRSAEYKHTFCLLKTTILVYCSEAGT